MLSVERIEQHELQTGEREFWATLRFTTEDLQNDWPDENPDSALRRAAEGMSPLYVAKRSVEPSKTVDEITFKEYAGLDAITMQPVVLPNPESSVVEPPIEPTPAQLSAQDALAMVKPTALANAANEAFVDMAALAKTLPPEHPLAQIAAPAEAPKRKRKQPADVQTPAENLPVPPTPPTGTLTTTVAVQVTPTLPAQSVEPPKVEKLLNPDQEKEIKERLAKYRNEVLPAGGMVPVDQIGGVEIQLRKFVAQFNPEKPSSKTWGYQDWLGFVTFLDNVVKISGASGLVDVMQHKIGIK